MNGIPSKAVTLEQKGRTINDVCSHCKAPCCSGFLKPILTRDELIKHKFVFEITEIPPWLKQQLSNDVKWIVTVKVTNNGCFYFNSQNHKCKVWPDCPKACLAYDCKEEDCDRGKLIRYEPWQET